METERGGYGYGGICGWFVAKRWSEEGDIGGLTKEIDGLKKEGDISGLRKEIDGLKKVSVGSLDVMVGMVGTIVKGKGTGSGGIVKSIVKGKRWFIAFFGFITFFLLV